MTLVYVLHYMNRLVPAVEAVKKLQVVRQADMERLLEHGVIVKAKREFQNIASRNYNYSEQSYEMGRRAFISIIRGVFD